MQQPLLSKQQALDLIDQLQKEKKPIQGIEVLRLHNGLWETSIYKTIWFTSGRGVYQAARTFIRHQMAGDWQMAEIKMPFER
jgi:hypothetical protein